MTKTLLLGLCLFVSSFIYSQVVINELDADTPGVDTAEFIELKSATPFFPLDGYILVFFNGGSGTGVLSYYAIDLAGLVTDGNGIVLLGNAGVSPAPSFIFPQNTIQNGPDAVAIYQDLIDNFPTFTPATNVNLIDALVHGNNNTQATSLIQILGVTAQINENANGLITTQSIQRRNDGTYEVKAPTPRANNDGSGIIYNGISIQPSATTLTEGSTLTLNFVSDIPVSQDVTFILQLNNGTFNAQDFTGITSLTIAQGNTTTSTQITILNDGINDGDEVMNVFIPSLPEGYIVLNNSVKIRVRDVNFTTLNFGTPLNPTFGNVTSTAPAGYYASLEGLSGSALKQALQDIIANPDVVRAHTYGDVIEILNNADQNPLNNNEVWLMYVEQPRSKLDYQTGPSIVGFWNREHIWPQSRGGFANGTFSFADGINIWLPTNADDILSGHSDAYHIRAEDGQENSSRNNRDYGSDYNGPPGNQGSWRGDVARALFYMAVRYNGLNLVNGNPPDSTMFEMGDLASLLVWNFSDPADDFEMNRNNYIYNWQMNRNPFVDYPQLADYIFGNRFGDQWFAPLDINEVSIADQVKVYPIPTQDSITISGLDQEAQVRIYSISGTEVLNTQINGMTQLPLNLAPGVYLMNIESNQQTVTKKIIIK
jgi:hypothetical protein